MPQANLALLLPQYTTLVTTEYIGRPFNRAAFFFLTKENVGGLC